MLRPCLTVLLFFCSVNGTRLWFELPDATDEDYKRCSSKMKDPKMEDEKSKQLFDVKSVQNVAEGACAKSPKNTHCSGIGLKHRLWKNGRIPMVLDTGLSKEQFSQLACAIKFFHAFTCVTFEPKLNSDTDFLNISNSLIGCFSSSLGNEGGHQLVNLDSFCWKHGTVIHELMHVVGLFHEQARNDRDKYVKVNWENIPKSESWKTQFMKAKDIPIAQRMVGNYDYESIMHYDRGIGNFPTKPYMTALKEPIDEHNAMMGNRKQPTKMDILKINELYGCIAKIHLVGGNGGSPDIKNAALKTVELFNPTEPLLNRISSVRLRSRRMGHVTGVLDGQPIIAGGLVRFWALKTTELFNLDENAWIPGPKMRMKRGNAAAVVLNNMFLVCGGWNGKTDLRSCEYLVKNSQKWVMVRRTMATRRRSPAAVALDDRYVFVLGGSLNGKELSSMERFDSRKSSWTPLASMKYSRNALAATVFDGKIIACGGEAFFMAHRSCEAYDPVSDSWRDIASMHHKRVDFALVNFEEKLYALGGWFAVASNTTEVYDSLSDSWKWGPELQSPRREFGVFVL